MLIENEGIVQRAQSSHRGERFIIAIYSAWSKSVIVVKNHSHQPSTSTFFASKPSSFPAFRPSSLPAFRIPCLLFSQPPNFSSSHPLSSYLSVNAATPGRVLPSINSSEAPPPVETWDTLSATPALATADAESPPPITVTAPRAVTSANSLAMA